MRAQRGFTMVEILVVLTVMSILSISLFTVFNQSMRSWRKAEARLDIYQNARVAFDQMTRELRDMVLYYDPANSDFSLIGDDDDPDEIAFVTRIFTDQGENGELCRIRYYLNGGNLLRYVDRNVSGTGSAATLALDVTDMQFEYWNGSSWGTAWDSSAGGSQQGTLPAAVRFSLTVRESLAAGTESKTFQTVVAIPTR